MYHGVTLPKPDSKKCEYLEHPGKYEGYPVKEWYKKGLNCTVKVYDRGDVSERV
jgi:hypothetical protein